jgi:hypothetical protein
MPDLAMDEHGGEPQAVSRRAFLSTGAAGISAAALVPGAPDATAQTGAQTDRPGKDAAMSLSRQFAAFVTGLRYEDLPASVVDRAKGVTLEALASALVSTSTSSPPSPVVNQRSSPGFAGRGYSGSSQGAQCLITHSVSEVVGGFENEVVTWAGSDGRRASTAIR